MPTGTNRALSDQQVAYVRTFINNENLFELAEELDISYPTMRNALLGVTPYDEVTIPPPLDKVPRQKRRNLGNTKKGNGLVEDVKKLYRKLNDSPSLLDQKREKLSERVKTWGVNRIIAMEFDISPAYVSRIHNGYYDDDGDA